MRNSFNPYFFSKVDEIDADCASRRAFLLHAILERNHKLHIIKSHGSRVSDPYRVLRLVPDLTHG